MSEQQTVERVERIRAGLLRALEAREHVRLRRRPRFAQDLDGFVVGVGAKWALLQNTRDGGHLDGWIAVRVADVRRIRAHDSFERRVAERQSEWPPAPPLPVALDRTADLLRSVAAEPLIGIEKERERSAQWIGTVEGVDHGRVWLHEIDPQARWKGRELGYRLRAITRVQLRTEYLNALASVAPVQPEVAPAT